MMLQVNSPFSRNDASPSSSSRTQRRRPPQQQQQQQPLHADLAQQLRDSMEECNRLRQALQTLNDSSLNYKNNAERALELAKKEMMSLKSQLADAVGSKAETNKLRAQIVRLKRAQQADAEAHGDQVQALEQTVAALRDEVEDAQETIHRQRVKFQGAHRDKQQQLHECRDGLRSLQQKVTFLEKENEQLTGFLAKEQQQAARGRGLIARLERVVQRLSDDTAPPSPPPEAPDGRTATTALAADEEERYRAMVSLLQKEKLELEDDNQVLLQRLAEADVKHADEAQAAADAHRATELRLLNHITSLRAEVTRLKGSGGDFGGGGGGGGGGEGSGGGGAAGASGNPPPPTQVSLATLEQTLPPPAAASKPAAAPALNPQTLLERARRRKELAASGEDGQ